VERIGHSKKCDNSFQKLIFEFCSCTAKIVTGYFRFSLLCYFFWYICNILVCYVTWKQRLINNKH
jgi:hypothetical protein